MNEAEREECEHCFHKMGQRGGSSYLNPPENLLQCCHCGEGKTQIGKRITDPEHGRYQPVFYRFEDA